MKRVLMARLDSAGDVLLAGPAVRAVASSGAQVWMLCGSRGREAAELLPGVAGILVYDAPWVGDENPFAPSGLAGLIDQVRALAPEEAIILTSFHQSPLPLALLLRLAGVPRIAGASVDAPGRLLDVRLIPGEDFVEEQPEPLRALRIASAAGYGPADDDDLLLAVRPLPDVSDLVGDEPYVVVHPGSSAPARSWPAQRFARAVELLAAAGRRVVVTGSAQERALTAEVAAGRALDLGGRCSFAQLGAVLAGACATVAANTGPAHLSAAVGTPVVSLFSPVVPAIKWRPYGVPCVLLGDQSAPCRLSRARVCPVPGHPCLTSVTPESVVDAVDSLVGPVRARQERGVR